MRVEIGSTENRLGKSIIIILNEYQGGLLRSCGRAANQLFEVGCCGEGTGPGIAYKRTQASQNNPWSWVLEGLDESDLTSGRNGLGGGSIGHEIDRFDVGHGSPAHCKIPASSVGHADDLGLSIKESRFLMINTLGTRTDKKRNCILI